jgi:hypothetical protein
MLGIHGLVALAIFGFHITLYKFRKGCLSQVVKGFFEFLVVSVIQEAKGPAPRGSIIDHLRNQHIVFSEIEFVPDPDLSSRVDQDIPKSLLTIQLSQEEDLDLGPGLFLISIKASRENFCIVEYQDVFVGEIIQDVFKYFMLYGPFLSVNYHKPGFISVPGRIFRNQIFREVVLVLG